MPVGFPSFGGYIYIYIYICIYIYVKLHMKGMIYQQIICDICMNESYEQYLQRRYRGIVQELLPARV